MAPKRHTWSTRFQSSGVDSRKVLSSTTAAEFTKTRCCPSCFSISSRAAWTESRRTMSVGTAMALLPNAAFGVLVVRQGRQTDVRLLDAFDVDLDHGEGGGQVKAPMHGKVVGVYVAVGDTVSKGQQLAIVEAMKMEHILTAPFAGVIASLAAKVDQQIAEGGRILTIAAAAV